MPIISVIVTVHNAERYLRECLDSVVAQTFSDIEILCMDGGSRDTSPQILKEYAKGDERIRIINDPNTSSGHKINEGIRQAGGEYISVLESDDMYEPYMLERLYAIAEKYHPDFVNADYLEFWETGGRKYRSRMRMYPEQDYNKLLESGKHPEDMRQIFRYWTGIFKKDFLVRENIMMNESPGASFQDMSFRFLTSALAKTCYHLDMPVYLYRTDNPASSMSDTGRAVVLVDEFAFLKGELEKRNIENSYLWRHFYVWKYNDIYGNLIRCDGEAREAVARRCQQELEKDREILERNDSREYSEVVSRLLDHSWDELQELVETTFRKQQAEKARRARIFSSLQGCKVVIFGCGKRGRAVLDLFGFVPQDVYCLTDNNTAFWHGDIEGHRILPPEDAVMCYPQALYIVANQFHAQEIVEQLQDMGITENRICVY